MTRKGSSLFHALLARLGRRDEALSWGWAEEEGQGIRPFFFIDGADDSATLTGVQLRDTCPQDRGRVWGARRILPEVAGLYRVMLGFARGGG